MTGSRKSTIACTLLVAAATLVIVVSATRGGFGQQAVIPTQKAVSTGELEGRYYVRLQLVGESEIVFEQVRTIDVRDHWASLEIIENDQLATLMLPRENVKYIKSWPIEADGRK